MEENSQKLKLSSSNQAIKNSLSYKPSVKFYAYFTIQSKTKDFFSQIKASIIEALHSQKNPLISPDNINFYLEKSGVKDFDYFYTTFCTITIVEQFDSNITLKFLSELFELVEEINSFVLKSYILVLDGIPDFKVTVPNGTISLICAPEAKTNTFFEQEYVTDLTNCHNTLECFNFKITGSEHIKTGILDILKIEHLCVFTYHVSNRTEPTPAWCEIVKKYIGKPNGVSHCQTELFKNGLKSYAKLSR